jgi:pilus assembly protein TadC
MKNILYLHKFGKAFVPKKLRPYLREYFFKAGYQEVPYNVFGGLFWLSVLITYVAYVPFLYPLINDYNPVWIAIYTLFIWAGIQAATLAFLGLLYYFNINVKIYRRTKELEEKLPEYLNLVGVNLKGGMSFEKALWAAIKPEFGVLAREITLVSKKVMTGNDIKDALLEFSRKYDSPILRRSIDLLVGEVEGGGKIVQVIDDLVANLKQTQALKQELRVNTQTYTIFLTAIVVVIAPALFAVSYQLLVMITGFTSGLGGGVTGVDMPIQIGGSSVSTQDFRYFSYLAVSIISVFSAMIVSIINKGDIKGGLKYIPAFLIGSLLMYTVLSAIATALFSGITG